MDNEEIARQLQESKDLSLRNQARIEKLEKGQQDIHELTKSVSAMVSEQKHMNLELTEVKTDVKQIKEKPGKHWDGMVDKILTVIIGAIVAYMLTKIGF